MSFLENFMNKFRSSENKSNLIDTKDVFLLTTYVVSSYDDGSHDGPKMVKVLFYATKGENAYYELFSGMEIKPFDVEHPIECFDKAFMKKAEPLAKYLRNPNDSMMKASELMEFLTLLNTQEILKARTKLKQNPKTKSRTKRGK